MALFYWILSLCLKVYLQVVREWKPHSLDKVRNECYTISLDLHVLFMDLLLWLIVGESTLSNAVLWDPYRMSCALRYFGLRAIG